ncbi:unnamed protein product [Cladocopium goreaui]|uniref:Uncharacterized protein n=1 Tax=Cladocopium goreaui TaxID=2562237 RepID=A0A9P1D915_9DINO|nr:unnamed protein product [Cladocopium goreaui]
MSLRRSCHGYRLFGRAGSEFADDHRAERLQDEVTKAVRDRQVMREVIQKCPPLALKLLLLFVEQIMRAPMEADLAEAREVHLAFNTVKVWLLHDVLPKENPEEVIAGWNLEKTEAKFFNHYKNIWRAIYTRDADRRDGEESGPDFIAMALDRNQRGHETSRSQSFYGICPEAEKSQHVNVLEEGQWGKVVEGPVPSKMLLIGNSLSLYWQARGLAELIGAAFLAAGGQELASRFTDFLPRATRQGVPWSNFSTEVALICRACPEEEDWRWPHSCLGSWFRPILPMVQADTQRALHSSGAEAAVRAFLRRYDAVIHFRCFPHFDSASIYPLAAFSMYAALPPSMAVKEDLRFIIVSGPLGEPCSAAARALGSYLQRRFPQAEVVQKFGSAPEGKMSEDLSDGADEEFDFALQVYAPVLFRSPSSFSLWAALARNEDQLVITAVNPPKLAHYGWRWPSANFGRNWRWVEVPLLTREVVAKHKFNFKDHHHWVEWLETH